MNATELIARYIKLGDHIDKRSKVHSEELAPYHAARTAINNELSRLLIETSGTDEGKANIATPAGTAFRKSWTSVKVADRPTFFTFVTADWDARQCFLTSAVTKSEVIDFIEREKAKPPGIDITKGYETHVNRPK